MPRNQSGVYSKPPNTTASPNTTIQSAVFNSVIDDLVSDANTARPLSAGGTGATNATEAQENLGIDHLVGAAPEVSAASALDNIDHPGWVYVASANCTTVGGPTGGGDGFVETGYTLAKRYQVYHPVSATLSPWRRVYTANAWTAWKQDVTTATGANGTYERFRSGLQICQLVGLTLNFLNTSVVAGTWTFPASFVSTSFTLTGSVRDISGAAPSMGQLTAIYPVAKAVGSVSVRVNRINGMTDFGSNDQVVVDVTAIGRWA